MAAPKVEWFNQANTAAVANISIGTIDAGTISAETSVLIWNNRGQGTAVSDMTSCSITTKDSTGNNTAEFVANKWMEVKVVSLGEATFTPIGGVTTKAIRATDATVAAGTITGIVNDGTYANAKKNFCEVALRLNVPTTTTTTGQQNGFVRVTYQYV